MIVDYGGDRETNIVSAPMGAGVRVSVCFSATMSVLSSGGTCGRIVEYGGDIETSTASVPTVFFFCFSATISVLSGGVTCARIVEYKR
jgi:hypothetical protein